MKYGSVCSGIEAATVAWKNEGLFPAWFAEIEPFPCAVLSERYPTTPNYGDMMLLPAAILSGSVEAPDILVGGTPCQAFSVAGLREGLADSRGQLTLSYVRIADAIDFVRSRDGTLPCVTLWENVPGVLSSKDNAFGCFLGAIAGEGCELQPSGKKWTNAGCVYGPRRAVAWRVLDAQYFGLAQRRKRVFVVASARNGFDPSAVLFERDSVRRDSAPCRGAWPPVAALTANGAGTCGADDNQAQGGHLLAFGGNNTAGPIDVATARNACATATGRLDFETETFVVHGTQDPGLSDIAFAMGRNSGQENAVIGISGELNASLELVGTLDAGSRSGGGQPAMAMQLNQVRRLTPKECERLQGFPDDYTMIRLHNKKPSDVLRFCVDGPRYKAIGNSMAVPVMRWIGKRIISNLTGN